MSNIDEYVNKIINDDKFIRLKELKKVIDEKYKKEIIAFKNAEALYIDAKHHEAYYPGFNEIKEKFILAKSNLYSKIEVSEYFKLEREIQSMINDDINDLKSSISNKFSLTKDYKI